MYTIITIFINYMKKIDNIIENIIYKYLNENVLLENENGIVDGNTVTWDLTQKKQTPVKPTQQQGEDTNNTNGWNYNYTYDYNDNYSQSSNPQTYSYSVPQATNNIQEPQQDNIPSQEPIDMEEPSDLNNYQEVPLQAVDYSDTLSNKGNELQQNTGDIYGVINMNSEYPISNALLNLVRGNYLTDANKVFKIMSELEKIGW